MKQKWMLFVTLLLASLVIVGCGSKETITLVENAWPASELNVAVAKIAR